jgi:hypothetical protein
MGDVTFWAIIPTIGAVALGLVALALGETGAAIYGAVTTVLGILAGGFLRG